MVVEVADVVVVADGGFFDADGEGVGPEERHGVLEVFGGGPGPVHGGFDGVDGDVVVFGFGFLVLVPEDSVAGAAGVARVEHAGEEGLAFLVVVGVFGEGVRGELGVDPGGEALGVDAGGEGGGGGGAEFAGGDPAGGGGEFLVVEEGDGDGVC